MNELFLHFVWKNRLYELQDTSTVSGLPLKVIDPGMYNRDSGPDFTNARLKIGETEWAGNVEIHLKSSMWTDHKHQLDSAYNNVILHVVLNFDKEISTADDRIPDTFVIHPSENVYLKYEEFLKNPSQIACNKDLKKLDSFFIRHWIHNVAIKRLEARTQLIETLFKEHTNDWEQTLYILIAENLGMKVNKYAFHTLAHKVPLQLIRKHSDSILSVEALFFGQAGMLDEKLFKTTIGDDYFDILKREYKVLKSKYMLSPMLISEWKFHRIRPVNFPTRRISQLATLMVNNASLFSKLIEVKRIEDFNDTLTSNTSEYWCEHYRFGVKVKKISGLTGKTLIDTILINAVFPLIFFYGKAKAKPDYCDRAIDLIDKLPAENNRILREWNELGIKPKSALESQGLIELTNNFCKNKDCLNCHIGTKLISLGSKLDPEANLSLGESEPI